MCLRAELLPFSPRPEPYSPRAEAYSPRSEPYSPRSEPYSPRSEPSSPRAEAYSPSAEAFSKDGVFKISLDSIVLKDLFVFHMHRDNDVEHYSHPFVNASYTTQ